MKGVLKRILVGSSLTLAVVGCLWLAHVLPTGALAYAMALLLVGLSVHEVARMGSLAVHRLGPALTAAAVAVALAAALPFFPAGAELVAWAPGTLQLVLALAAALVALAVHAVTGGPSGSARRWAGGLAFWCVPALFGLAAIDRGWGVVGLSALVLLSKIGDIFGYFVGRAIGRRHPFPGISPGKTVAGCVASLVAGIVAGAAIAPAGWPAPGAGPLAGALSGLGLNLAAQGGDLFESWVKRRAGVKDSSALFGPSGGVLDVVDSLLFTVPAALLLWPILFQG